MNKLTTTNLILVNLALILSILLIVVITRLYNLYANIELIERIYNCDQLNIQSY